MEESSKKSKSTEEGASVHTCHISIKTHTDTYGCISLHAGAHWDKTELLGALLILDPERDGDCTACPHFPLSL